jgi:hypothetical protein
MEDSALSGFEEKTTCAETVITSFERRWNSTGPEARAVHFIDAL